MPFDHVWDITQPPDTQLANLLGQDIRNLKDDIMQRISALSGLDAAKPAPETVNANWTGLLFFATDTGIIYQWNGAAWVNITASFIKAPGISSFLDVTVLSVSGTTPGIVIPGNTLAVGSVIEMKIPFGYGPTGSGFNNTYKLLANGGDLLGAGVQLFAPASVAGTIAGILTATIVCDEIGVAGELSTTFSAIANSPSGTTDMVPPKTLSAAATLDTTSPITISINMTLPAGNSGAVGPTKALLY